jgi:hypothetical protein
MNISDLSARLDRVERANRRLYAVVVGLVVIVIGLATVVVLRPAAPVEAQGRVYAAQSFQLTDDDGIVLGQFALDKDGQPSLQMWQGPRADLATGTNPYLLLGIGPTGQENATYLQMGTGAYGMLMIQTSQNGHWPSVAIYPPGGGAAVWDTPYR